MRSNAEVGLLRRAPRACAVCVSVASLALRTPDEETDGREDEPDAWAREHGEAHRLSDERTVLVGTASRISSVAYELRFAELPFLPRSPVTLASRR